MSTLNLEQAAAFLHMHPITLLRKAQVGDIPGAKLAKRWVFIQVDLEQYLRSKYTRQALQGDHNEELLCHSTKEVHRQTGGSKSRSQAVSKYGNLLGLPTNTRLLNTKQS